MLDQLRAKKAAADLGVGGAVPAPPLPPAAVAPPLLSLPQAAPVPVAANQIIGVNEQGLNLYTHHESSHEYIGNAADGRKVWREKRNAAPIVALAAPMPSNPPPIAVAPTILGTGAIASFPSIPGPSQTVQPINPPESSLAPAPPAGDAGAPKKRGRPSGAKAPNLSTVSAPADLEDAIQFAKAMRAGCDAFLAALGEQ